MMIGVNVKFVTGNYIMKMKEDGYKRNKLKTINDLILSIKNIYNG